jgi:hypothetical protein
MAHKENVEKKTVYRDSEKGQFPTKRYAETHKATTERERVPVRPPEPPKNKK